MKNIFKRTVSLLLAAGIAVASSTAVSATAPMNLVVLGDSIATGFRLEGYETNKPETAIGSFGNLVAEEYGLKWGDSYFNFGVDGLQTAELLEKLEEDEVNAALENADSIVVSIGGNDFLSPLLEMLFDAATASKDELSAIGIEIDTTNNDTLMQSIAGLSTEDINGEEVAAILMKNFDMENMLTDFNNSADIAAENISAIIDRLYEITPDASVYLLTVLNPFSGVKSFESVGMIATLVLSRLNKAIENLAISASESGYSAGIADVYDAYGGDAEKYTNINEFDIHPNAEGHRLIADLLEAAMDYYTDEPTIAEQPDEAEDSDNAEETDEAEEVEESEEIDTVEEPDEPDEVEEGEEPEEAITDAPVPDKAENAANPPTGISSGTMLIGVIAAATAAVIMKRKKSGK